MLCSAGKGVAVSKSRHPQVAPKFGMRLDCGRLKRNPDSQPDEALCELPQHACTKRFKTVRAISAQIQRSHVHCGYEV